NTSAASRVKGRCARTPAKHGAQVGDALDQQPRTTIKQRYGEKVTRPGYHIATIGDHFFVNSPFPFAEPPISGFA
ncbi:MAG: hypothetical protein AABZ84_01520, partial [Pseudomonadota bacterium]